MLLLDVVVLAFTSHPHAERISIEAQRRFAVVHDDRRVINAEKDLRRWLVPLRAAFPWRKENDLQKMTVRIAKVERADSAGVGIPIRKALRSARGMLYMAVAQQLIGFRDVADDDRDVLEEA